MRNILHAIQSTRKNDFIKNTAMLTTGTIVAQIIPLFFYPVLSRLFTPDDFGVLAAIISLSSILGVLATGKYEAAILIAPTKQLAAELIILIILVSSTFLTIAIIILLVFSESFSSLFNNSDLQSWIIFAPLIAFCSIIYTLNNEWCVRNEYFKILSLNKIINGSSISITKTSLGFAKILSGGLVIGEFLGRFFTAGICTIQALKKDKDDFLKISLARIVKVAKRYSEFPKYILLGQILNTFNAQLTTFVLLSFFSTTELGYYSMAQTILILPALVVTYSVRDVFRKKANDIFLEKGNSIVIFDKTLLILAGISLLGFSIFYFIAPFMFSLVLGQQWYTAGKYAQILSPMVAISFVTEVGASMFIIAEKTKQLLYWQITYIILSVTSLLIGYFCFGDVESMLFSLMIGASIAHFINFLMCRKFAKGN